MKNKNNGRAEIAVIGGSGLYDMDELSEVREINVRTPFGPPSDAIFVGKIAGVFCAFLPRHARGHKLLPVEIPQKANIYALKILGVRAIISMSAVGSLREELAPKHFVFSDQLVDETRYRENTFFGKGIVAHVGMANPFCGALSDFLYERSRVLNITAHKGGTYVCIEGPAFSTKAESEYHRKMGYSIIGMTVAPEAKLAREAGICYAPISLVTDYDVWKEGEEVTAAHVVKTLEFNIGNARKLLADTIPRIGGMKFKCACGDIIKQSVITPKKAMPKQTYKKLSILFGGAE